MITKLLHDQLNISTHSLDDFHVQSIIFKVELVEGFQNLGDFVFVFISLRHILTELAVLNLRILDVLLLI